MSSIVYKNICKTYGKRSILQDATLTLHAGKCSLLFGPNGVGKTTLQRICSGLEKPNSGHVNARNDFLTWKRHRHYLQKHCVYLHQQAYMFDGSVIKNLAYALPRSVSKKERHSRIELALQWAGLENISDSWAKTLSGGERQRVALARAWLRSPRYMLLDEPTNNLDEAAKQRTLALLMSLKMQGIALLITSHDTQHFESITDNWLELRKGKIITRLSTTLHYKNVIQLPIIQQA